ncbi:MAG: glycosyltransferase [Cyclobacteriaceae bacterium]|nr:glycosyltransferase [Cyclobacteriaceae bacterium HetDA_MAG_MS6]
MNIFVIPSWYPSRNNPIYGIFVQEQCYWLAQYNPDINIGISKWGQGDDDFLLWANQPLTSALKRVKYFRPYDSQLLVNCTEYFHPAFTWTRKIFNGNIKGIIKANEKNFLKFRKQYGVPDVLHAQSSYPAVIIARWLSEKYQVPYVVTMRMSPFPFKEFLNKDGSMRSIIFDPLKKSNALIVDSTFIRVRAMDFGLPKPEVIHNPVDLDFFSVVGKSTQEEKSIFAVGRLVEQKGFDVLLEALPKLRGTKLKVKIGGEGEMSNLLKEKTEKLDLHGVVEWLGPLDRMQVRDEMQACDLFVLPSRHETFGIVLIEAMACGKPVVATDCGGPADIINSTNGILCKPNDVQGLSEAIDMALKKDWDTDTIRNDVNSRFSISVFSEKIRGIYADVTRTVN